MYQLLRERNFKHFFRWLLISALVGVFAGVAAVVFLSLLSGVTELYREHPQIVWALPLGGFLVGYLYFLYGQDVAAGNNLILDEIHDPKRVVPFRMAPLVLFGTMVTHLFGGSAGREGAAVQISASLADQLSKPFRLGSSERKAVLMAGAGAGFGAAIGAPWAGVIFGMEVIQVGRLRPYAVLECFIASFVAFYMTKLLGIAHAHYPEIQIPDLSLHVLVLICAVGMLFGLYAQVFARFTHLVEAAQKRFVKFPPLKPFLGGLLLVWLYHLEGSYRFVGLGLEGIQAALRVPAHWLEPVWKALFSAIMVGTGFKGGEFVPLVYMGTTLGSALSAWIPLSAGFLGALGFAALFGGAANTPLACTVMAAEIFGWRIAPFALVACYASFYFSGHHGIYSAQRIHRRKEERLRKILHVRHK